MSNIAASSLNCKLGEEQDYNETNVVVSLVYLQCLEELFSYVTGPSTLPVSYPGLLHATS